MRPIRLTMQAFGSYGSKTIIDFEKPSQNLFLISGDTGSGKSTIFDAVVFALYGEASSENNKKSGSELQSQFAGLETDPYVELIFSEKEGGVEQIYTVVRVPKHLSPLKRKSSSGKSFKESPETVSLILPDGTEYNGKIKETNAKIEEIVNLTKSQFMQIAMIAQGEFMSSLRAKTSEKKETFRKLFHTEIYQEMVEKLAERKKNKKAEIDHIRTVFQTEAAHIQIPEEYEGAAELEEAKRRIRMAKEISVVDMETITSLLPDLCEYLKQRRTVADKEQRAADLTRKDASATYEKAKVLMNAFVSLEAAQKDMEDCLAQTGRMQELDKLQKNILDSYEIRDAYNRMSDMKDQLNDTIEKRAKQQEALPQLTVLFSVAEKEEQKAKTSLDTENSAYGKVAQKVENALDVFRKIQRASAEISQKERLCRNNKQQVSSRKRDLDAYEQQILDWRREESGLEQADTLLLQWTHKMDACREMEKAAADCRRQEEAVGRQQRKAERTAKNYQKARTEYEKKSADYSIKRKHYLDAQAGFIAREFLKEGQPCPVCGSLHHPSPCILADEYKDLTRDMIDELAEEVSNLEQAQRKAAEEAGSANSVLEEKQGQLEKSMKGLQEKMGSASFSSAADAENQIGYFRQLLEREEAELRSNVAKLQAVRKSLERSDAQKAAYQKAYEDARSEAEQLNKDIENARGTLKGLEAQKTYSSEDEAKQILRTAWEKQQDAENAHTRTKIAYNRAKSARESAENTIKDCDASIPLLQEKQAKLETAYQARMAQYDLSEQEWKFTVQENPKRRADELRKQRTLYDNRKSSAQGAIAAARHTINGQEKPDLERLETEAAMAQNRYESLKSVYDTCRELYSSNQKILKALTPQMEERRLVVADYNRISNLYDRLSGNVTGSRMDLETFVQRYYLERILHLANNRFREMSAGQYELRMVSKEEAGDGKNRGLDLMVYSTVTGKERAVNTLSGGESFIAALALALGMADQIQAASSAIHLDIMFIDEGFGSLDDHSREEAVRVLKQMADGSKLIGIISHVTELKQEIDDQLLITKDKAGSHATWQLS